LINAPRAAVLKAFADHKLIEQWWGPQGFRTVTKHLDFRPGGVWQHNMMGPDGTEFLNYFKYLQTGPETIDYVHGADETTIDFRAI
ncbi:SRPBCC domain-containing protein, partial [Acinetobacter baumannii]